MADSWALFQVSVLALSLASDCSGWSQAYSPERVPSQAYSYLDSFRLAWPCLDWVPLSPVSGWRYLERLCLGSALRRARFGFVYPTEFGPEL